MAMPAAAGGRAQPSVAAAASIAIEDLLTGAEQAATVVGSFPVATYLATAGGVVAIVTADAVRLPNALVLSPADHARVVRHAVGSAGGLVVGGGGSRLGSAEIRIGRWWDPVPRLGDLDPAAVQAALAEVEPLLPLWPGPDDPASDLLAEGRQLVVEVLAGMAAPEKAAHALVGLGAGLTPAGDDLLAGAVAGSVIFGRALGAEPAVVTAMALADAAAQLATRTTSLAADLTMHAAAGAVAEPVADVCRAFTDKRRLREALARLLATGHTSGRDLAEGLVVGVRAATTPRPLQS